jgi:antirestriction protein ArdC
MPQSFTEEERQQRREADRERAYHAVEALASSKGWQRWLSLRHRFHRYSLSNQCLIAAAMPHATRVAGFKAWLKLGYCVRKGEQAVIRIWMPMPPTKRQIATWEAAGARAEDRPRVRFRLGPVWDRSQVTELPPPAEPVPLDPPIVAPEGDSLAWAFPRLTALAGELRCAVLVEPMPAGQGGFFAPEQRVIALNEKNSINHQVKTFVHELAHALMRHTTELQEIALTYSQEELVVESIAFSVVGGLGVDTTGYSIPYLASWSQDEEDGLAIVERCASLIDQLARRIEDAVHQPASDGDQNEPAAAEQPAAEAA